MDEREVEYMKKYTIVIGVRSLTKKKLIRVLQDEKKLRKKILSRAHEVDYVIILLSVTLLSFFLRF